MAWRRRPQETDPATRRRTSIALVVVAAAAAVVRELVFGDRSLPMFAVTYFAVYPFVFGLAVALRLVLFAWERVPD